MSPPTPQPQRSQKQSRFLAEAIVRRARTGTFGYLMLSATALATTSYPHSRPLAAAVAGALTAAAGTLRFVMVRRARHCASTDDPAYRRLFAAIVLSGVVWGALAALVVASGFDGDAVVVVTAAAIAAAAAGSTMAPDLRLTQTYIACLLAPIGIAALFADGRPGAGAFVLVAILCYFLLTQARDTHLDFVGSAERAEALEARADALESERGRAEAADAASRAKSEFVANMSHEIRTPLTAIMGYSELLLGAGMSDAERIASAETIRRNGEHLLGVLNDILDLSKIEAGKMTVEAKPCDVPGVLLDVASLMRVRAIERGLTFEIGLDSPVPEQIVGDALRLRQILLNLVGNAIKFTKRGGVRVRARVAPAADGWLLLVDVVDTGIGLTPGQIGHLFAPFSQVDNSATRRFQGSGLGLDLSQRLARMMGGDVRVQSEFGRGSTFTLAVPAGALEGVTMCPALDACRRVGSLSISDDRALAGLRLLLAEDSDDIRNLVCTVLRIAGARVEAAADGLEALEKATAAQAAGTPFDAVLMDMQMPRLDGYGATARLRAAGYRGPIAALTAHAMAGERERCIAAGCDDHLAKPVHAPTLIARVAQLVRRGGWRKTDSSLPLLAAPPLGGRPSPAPAPAAPDLGEDGPLASTMGDDPIVVKLIGEFYEAVEARGAEVLAALETEDFVAAARAAHQLAGSGGTFGFAPLTVAARAFERTVFDADSADDEARLRLAQALLRTCRRVLAGRPAADPPPAATPSTAAA